MAGTISAQEFKLLSEYIEKQCGIHLEESKMYLVESRLNSLMVENGCASYTELYIKASSDPTGILRDHIVNAMTTNETLWFRDGGPFEVLRELLDRYAAEIKTGKRTKVRIWSAACSTGQEPYSIAMTALESGRAGSGLRPEQVEIFGSDISSTVLFIAKAGRYDAIAINRGLPVELRDRYFRSEGRVWVLSNAVKEMVTFEKKNLRDSYAALGGYDIVFCRNVLIYFSDNFKREVFSRLAGVLRPAGFLFVGASESVSNYSGDYTMYKNAHGLYYQVKQG